MRDYDKIKKECKEIESRCDKCNYVSKIGIIKGVCKVRDGKGLYPNQVGYGKIYE